MSEAGFGRDFRVLIYAHVDLNAVDGSAFFVSGAASLLSARPGVQVNVITATHLRRSVVVKEMLVNPAVSVTDPFADASASSILPFLRGNSRMSVKNAAKVIAHYADSSAADVIIVRHTPVAAELARLRPDLATRLAVYVTGITDADRPVTRVQAAPLLELSRLGACLLFQTEEMRNHLLESLDANVSLERTHLMPPSVPATSPVMLERERSSDLRLVYAGKFASGWNPIEIFSTVKRMILAGHAMRLDVAGDHFKAEPTHPRLRAEVLQLLSDSGPIQWHGAIPREEARRLIRGADVSISWRSAQMDSSLEFSTKVLEAGSLGVPSILNRTPMHERLLGEDYELYANSRGEFTRLLGEIVADRSVLERAASRAFETASKFTYLSVFDQVFPVLLALAIDDDRLSRVGLGPAEIAELFEDAGRTVRLGDWNAVVIGPDGLAPDTVESFMAEGVLTSVVRLGPVIAWRETEPEAVYSHGDRVGAIAQLARWQVELVPAEVRIDIGADDAVAGADGRVRLGQAAGGGAGDASYEELQELRAAYRALRREARPLSHSDASGGSVVSSRGARGFFRAGMRRLRRVLGGFRRRVQRR